MLTILNRTKKSNQAVHDKEIYFVFDETEVKFLVDDVRVGPFRFEGGGDGVFICYRRNAHYFSTFSYSACFLLCPYHSIADSIFFHG